MARKPIVALIASAALLASCGHTAAESSSSTPAEESSSSSSVVKTPEQQFQTEITKGLVKFAAAERIQLNVDLVLSGSVTMVNYALDEDKSTAEVPVYTDQIASTTEIDINELTIDGDLIAENIQGDDGDFRLGATSTGVLDLSIPMGDSAMAIKDDHLDFSAYVLNDKVYIDASGVLESYMPIVMMLLQQQGLTNLPPLTTPFYLQSDATTMKGIKEGFLTYGRTLFTNFTEAFGEPEYSNQNHTASIELTMPALETLLQGLDPAAAASLEKLTLDNLVLSETFTDPSMEYSIKGGVAMDTVNLGNGSGLAFDLDLDLKVGMTYSAPVLNVPSDDVLATYQEYVPTPAAE